MSVIRFSREDFAAINSTIFLRSSGSTSNPLFKLSEHQKMMAQALNMSQAQMLDDEIKNFVRNLDIANQLAYTKQYKHTMTAEASEYPASKMLADWELYDLLTSVYYNCYTNGGNMYLSCKDEDQLKSIINELANIQMRDHVRKVKERITAVTEPAK